MKYGYQKTVSISFKDVDSKIRSTLAENGFGVITEIDIKKTFKEKLNIDYPRFRILGACNPELAEKALKMQSEVAMLMPCNVVFWENEDSTVTLSAIDAEQQLSVTEHDDLIQIGKDVNIMLKTAIDRV
jgi:uncharacterized protein (DUF302 family)|tara:strand:- start:634 stop:1020 length:387 start_codon:yes stop_codon:yes gene_type:complete